MQMKKVFKLKWNESEAKRTTVPKARRVYSEPKNQIDRVKLKRTSYRGKAFWFFRKPDRRQGTIHELWEGRPPATGFQVLVI